MSLPAFEGLAKHVCKEREMFPAIHDRLHKPWPLAVLFDLKKWPT